MFAYVAIPGFNCVVYETETEIETAVFSPKTNRNRTDLEKSRTVTTLRLTIFQFTTLSNSIYNPIQYILTPSLPS